jgi:hypothetical protein
MECSIEDNCARVMVRKLRVIRRILILSAQEFLNNRPNLVILPLTIVLVPGISSTIGQIVIQYKITVVATVPNGEEKSVNVVPQFLLILAVLIWVRRPKLKLALAKTPLAVHGKIILKLIAVS